MSTIQGRCDFLVELQLRERGQPRSGALAIHQASATRAPTGVHFISNTITNRRTHPRTPVARLDHAARALQFTMALARPLPPLWQSLLPALNGPFRPVLNPPFLQRIAQPFRTWLPTPFAALAIPSITLPSFPSLGDIWDGILKAVPKKKTSYMKKRTRFMAGKGLKDITALTKCSACGRVKRAHILCPYCVDGMCSAIQCGSTRG